ncbi:hypothetical protein NO932_12915 [Pelagibacterium sp. 26DY04]|uniref:hypothetical protein n=1 Tax=Pelagibacterium sp. 26DY04 TaxID=2967130 RepID=UPI002815CAA2|nr:hypothetical protein [Pelagibacterium sp. 26DY04]WMT85823.1 hypothetical protein NO932_12915 [Pelagibacterium sp. 26DY04]
MMFSRLATLLAFWLALAGTTMGQETTADTLRQHLYDGRLADGRAAMEALAEDDATAAFGLGVFTLLEGVEELAQALYVHGFNPQGGILVSPFFGMPAEEQQETREIEPLTYAALRGYLEAFSADMDTAMPLLEVAGAGDFAVEIDVSKIRIDIDGDGAASEAESVGAFWAMAAGMGQQLDMGTGVAPDTELPETVFAFDGSDAVWLAGYSQVLASQSDFLLAHDFETFFNTALHRLFPGAGLPMESRQSEGALFMDRDTDALLADAIAMIHTINWPITERERLLAVQERALRVLDLSRRNWDLILAETDDNREFVPSPYQTPLIADMAINKAMVEAWLETLDVTEAIVRGELLLPHWRYPGLGFDLSAWVENAERTDFVLLFTGFDALPYLQEGEIADAESFAAANRVFGGSIWNYALWFN